MKLQQISKLLLCRTHGLVKGINNVNSFEPVCEYCKCECRELPEQIFERNQIFLDIETMDTAQTSIIPQIGAIVVSPTGTIIDQVNLVIDLKQLGRTVSSSTMEFWMKQPDEARKSVFCNPNRLSLDVALDTLYDKLKKYNA